MESKLPSYDSLINPALAAIRGLGGSGSIEEIYDKVVELERLSDSGRFTPAAVKEATRDGAPAIDLTNGADLADKLKELHLGVNTSMVEVVTVEEGWFEAV